jgi:hypothetical protein
MDITFNCDKCGQHIAIDEAGTGIIVSCPKCNAPLLVPRQSTPPLAAATSTMPPTANEDQMKEYKVMTQKDRFFAGKFDPEKLEGAINSYASQGWTVRAIATASVPSLTGNREELVVVLEREK